MILSSDTSLLFGLCGAGLVGTGVYVVITHPSLLRRVVGFNILGAGTFLVFGAVARRGAASDLGADPVPQALVITGIVVAFSATALAVALLQRMFELTEREPLEAAPPDIEQESGS